MPNVGIVNSSGRGIVEEGGGGVRGGGGGKGGTGRWSGGRGERTVRMQAPTRILSSEPDRVELAATNSHNSANKLFIVIIISSLAMNYRNILCIIHSYRYTEQQV